MKPQTPTGARRTDGRKDRGKRPETPEEPLMIQEFALLTGRAAKGWTDGPRRMEPRGFRVRICVEIVCAMEMSGPPEPPRKAFLGRRPKD